MTDDERTCNAAENSSAKLNTYSQRLDCQQGASERVEGVYSKYMTDDERTCNAAENSSAKLNTYSQRLDCQQGASERVEGVYSKYMTDDERTCNAAENSSAKSVGVEFGMTKPITLLGAGSWGTALALYLGRRGQPVNIWSIDRSEIDAMIADRCNQRFMPGFPLPETICPMADLAAAVKNVNDILVVVPSIGFRHTLNLVKPYLTPQSRILCATKGLDAESGQLLNEVTKDVLGTAYPFAVLSGPSFAREVAAGLPCAVVIASENASFRNDLAQRFNSDIFRIYTSQDVIGVEVGGATKNVIAIATGISDGMALGANARSALITRGLSEIIRLGTALGGQLETFIGLAGLGDLILTCSDDQSRNRRLGLALGKGQSITAAEEAIGQVVEGKRNAELISQLAQQHGIEMPICQTIWQILQGKLSTQEAVSHLLSRPASSSYLSQI